MFTRLEVAVIYLVQWDFVCTLYTQLFSWNSSNWCSIGIPVNVDSPELTSLISESIVDSSDIDKVGVFFILNIHIYVNILSIHCSIGIIPEASISFWYWHGGCFFFLSKSKIFIMPLHNFEKNSITKYIYIDYTKINCYKLRWVFNWNRTFRI